jgi:hypothetical protein
MTDGEVSRQLEREGHFSLDPSGYDAGKKVPARRSVPLS